MKCFMKWLCVTCCVAGTLLADQAAEACGRCGFAICRLQSRPVHSAKIVSSQKLVPVQTPQSFHVTYNVAFPPPAVAGSTGFAYSVPQYPFLDPVQFINAASRYLGTAQMSASKGFSEFNQSSALVIGQQAQLAELQARAALMDQAAKLLAQTRPSGDRRLQLRASRDAAGRLRIEADAIPGVSLKVTDIVASRCAICHNANKKQGGLDLTNLDVLNRSYEAKILDRITTADPARRMPKGGTLSAEEISVFFRTSSLCGGKRP